MAAVDDNDSGRRQRRWRMTTAAEDNGTQVRAVNYEGEGGERVANNYGIRTMCRASPPKNVEQLIQ